MKRLFLLILVCLPLIKLAAQPYSPTSLVAAKDWQQFRTDYNSYRNASTDSLYAKLKTMDWHKPMSGSVYAFLFACLYRIDGEFADSYADWVYHYFKKHPEEYSVAASRLTSFSDKDQEDIRVKLFYLLYYTYNEKEESKIDEGYFFKSFPNARELFPGFVIDGKISHDFATSKNFIVPVWVCDRKDDTANVRDSPGGKVVARLSNEFPLDIDSIQGKWCRIAKGKYWSADDTELLEVKDRERWIHISCLGTDFVGIDNRTFYLHTEPSVESKSFPIQTEKDGDIDFILDKKNEWVKVQLSGGKIGWVHIAEICGNPYTICS